MRGRLQPLVTFWEYLRSAHRIGPYLKLLAWRHRRILGYGILVAGIVLSLTMVQHQNTHFNNLVIETGIQGRQASCQRDVALTTNIRSILLVSQRTTQAQHDKHVISDDQFARAEVFYADALRRLPVPDCEAYVEKYKDQIEAP